MTSAEMAAYDPIQATGRLRCVLVTATESRSPGSRNPLAAAGAFTEGRIGQKIGAYYTGVSGQPLSPGDEVHNGTDTKLNGGVLGGPVLFC
jgi:hypothetical protein